MRILLTIHHTLDPDSGAPGTTLQLADEYRRLGHTVKIWSFDDLPSVIGERANKVLFPLSVAGRAWKRRHEFDVIDTSTCDAWLWASLPSQARRPLLVTRCHGLEHLAHLQFMEEVRRGNESLSWKYWFYNGSLRLREVAHSLRRADLALFLNRAERDFAVTQLGVHGDRAAVVPNGLPEGFVDVPFERTPNRGGEIRIAQVGTFTWAKGVRYGARALAECVAANPEVSISLLGTLVPREAVLEHFPEEQHARIRVVPHYRRPELIRLLHGHQIKLLSGVSEGFGMSLVEAMACGLAPVITSTAGPLEIVRNGIEGLVVAPREPSALVEALQKLIDDRSLLDRMRRAAQQRARSFTSRNVALSRLRLYEQYLKRKHQPVIATPGARLGRST
jgi:glycosyltransferase involved in cell wall biosynthesis